MDIPSETLQRYIVNPNWKCWYPIHKKVVRTYPMPWNPYLELYCFSNGCLPFFRAYTDIYWRMKKIALAWIALSKTYYFTLKYDDLQRTNPVSTWRTKRSWNWVPVGTGRYDSGVVKSITETRWQNMWTIIF